MFPSLFFNKNVTNDRYLYAFDRFYGFLVAKFNLAGVALYEIIAIGCVVLI
jgi:hypothetical protein